MFVVGDSGVLVVDAQFSTAATRDVIAALRRITTKPVTYVVNTHGHDDHISGNQVYRDSFPGVEFIAHRSTRDAMVEGGATKRKEFLASLPGTIGFFRGALQSGKGPDGSPMTADERAGFASDSTIAAQFLAESPGLELVPATRIVDGRLTIQLGRRTVDIIHLGRGHSDGDIVVHLPADRIVASGDLVVSPVPLVGSTSHPAEFAVTLERLMALHPAVIVPGHGPVMRDAVYVSLVHRMLVSIRDQTAAAVARGDSLAEVRKRVNLDEFRNAIVGDSKLRRFVFANYVTGPAVAAQGEQVSWLRANATQFSDSTRDDDLASLGRALDGVDVIFLGESTHGDGGGHLARVRLVKYLHERLGFDVIAWEAGVREGVVFDSLLGTAAPLGTITPLALYPWWAPSAELRPVLDYVRQTRRSPRPLTFTGFDIQRSGPIDSLVTYISRTFARSGDSRLFPRALRDSLSRGFQRMSTLTGASRDSVEDALERTLHDAAPDLRRRFVSARSAFVRAVGEREADLFAHVLDNLVSHAEQVRLARETDPARRPAAVLASYNVREQRNADNLVWLVRQRHRGQKLIVWVHNVHAVNTRFTARFDGVVPSASDGVRDATARVVADSLGRRSYSAAMVAFDGAWGFPGGQVTELPTATGGSLPAMLHATGFARAFLDLRGTNRPIPPWLTQPIAGTLNAQSPARYPIVWPRTVDGVLFIDRMTPSTVAPQ
jgi:glyoxylase-like metal-dependent hydrolase (beta-lactamase superfamily II)/erythromycin esterase-like protein